jgi:ABC transporter
VGCATHRGWWHSAARVRVTQGKALHAAVEAALRSVNLWTVANKVAGQYSGGMKRRLSVAISLIGSPLVVYLDEPSTVSVLRPSHPCALSASQSAVCQQGRAFDCASRCSVGQEAVRRLCFVAAIVLSVAARMVCSDEGAPPGCGLGWNVHVPRMQPPCAACLA